MLMKQLFSQLALSLQETRRKVATVGVLAITALIAYHVIFGANGAMVYSKKKDEYRQLQKENEQLEQENKDLAMRDHALLKDRKTIEREARESLHYVRPGEVIYTEPAPAATPDRISAENRNK